MDDAAHKRAKQELAEDDPAVTARAVAACVEHGFLDLLLGCRLHEHSHVRAAAFDPVLRALEGPLSFPSVPTGEVGLPVYLGEAELAELKAHTRRLNDNVAGIVSRLCPLVATRLGALGEAEVAVHRHAPPYAKMTLKVGPLVAFFVGAHAWRLDASSANVVHAIIALGRPHLDGLPVRTD